MFYIFVSFLLQFSFVVLFVLGKVCSGCFYVVGFFRVFAFCFLKCQSYKWDIQPFLSVSQVFSFVLFIAFPLFLSQFFSMVFSILLFIFIAFLT